MTAPSDGWDADEREVLESDQLARALEAARAKHALSPQDEARLLERIQREARSGAGWRWTLALAAATVLVIGATWMFTRGDGTSSPPPDMTTAAAPVSPPAAPVFYLALEKPTIKISPAALVYRGPDDAENPLLADLKPAFDAYRAGEYRAADEEFSKLVGKYPSSVEIPFYQGVARLFLDNPQGAITSLGAAGRLADSSLAFDVSWYRAVAEERAGNLAGARAELQNLCAKPDTRAPTACEALKRLPQ